MLTQKPTNWRTGQTLFNFLEWLYEHGHAPETPRPVADTFHIPDDELEELYQDFLKSFS